LSGGSWLVGSMYTNNFTSVQDAINAPEIWQFDDSILKGTCGQLTAKTGRVCKTAG
jgi:lysophospholipase